MLEIPVKVTCCSCGEPLEATVKTNFFEVEIQVPGCGCYACPADCSDEIREVMSDDGKE